VREKKKSTHIPRPPAMYPLMGPTDAAGTSLNPTYQSYRSSDPYFTAYLNAQKNQQRAAYLRTMQSRQCVVTSAAAYPSTAAVSSMTALSRDATLNPSISSALPIHSHHYGTFSENYRLPPKLGSFGCKTFAVRKAMDRKRKRISALGTEMCLPPSLLLFSR
jgi:hypothetical protein